MSKRTESYPGSRGGVPGSHWPVALAVVLLAATGGARADELNGFLPAKGTTDIAVSVTAESYDHFWRGSEKVPTPDFLGEVETWTYTLWVRYGITDDLAVIFNVPHVDASTDGTDGLSAEGLQDISALLDYRFAQSANGRHSVLVAGGVRTPMRNYVAHAPVSVGDGTTDFLASFIYQYENSGTYVAQQLGYELRGGDVPNGVAMYTEVGHAWGRWTLSGFNSVYWSQSGTDIGDEGFTFPSNDEDRWRVGAKVYAQLTEHFGLGLSAYTSVDGRNTGDSQGVSFGTDFRF